MTDRSATPCAALSPVQIDTFLDEFLFIYCRVVGLNQADGNAWRHTGVLESLACIHLQFENHSCSIIGNALNQPIAENDTRRMLEWLNQVAAI